ncbi:MAG TPA: hypothetical protein VMS64_34420 [Candidatus Methylomirabilis sp.]|nr:hypothetical protein [Candidatus Methylomirabilis sp.]
MAQSLTPHHAAADQTAPASVPMVWMRLRTRWEYGHAAGFLLQFIGLGLLLLSVLVEAPKDLSGIAPRESAGTTEGSAR